MQPLKTLNSLNLPDLSENSLQIHECYWFVCKKTWESFTALHFRQNSIFHFTLYFTQSVLHFVHVCHLSLHSRFNFFAFNIQLWFMQHSSFRFRHSTFHKQQSSFRIRPSSTVECTFIFSHATFSICPLVFASDIRLWALYLQVSAFYIQLFELNFYPLVSDRWRSLAQLTWLTPTQMVVESVESRSRDFPVEWTRESFSTPDKQDVDNR